MNSEEINNNDYINYREATFFFLSLEPIPFSPPPLPPPKKRLANLTHCNPLDIFIYLMIDIGS